MNTEFPDRDPESHKGDNGYVGVIAGSRDYTGAPALVAEAALRAGCDLTKILTSESSRDVVASFSENLVVDSYSGDYFGGGAIDASQELGEWSDAVALGPGLGGDAEHEAVEEFVSVAEVPLVIDADAVEPAVEADFTGAVFTPHRGEVEAIEQGYGSVEEFVEETGAVVVVKGPVDRVYSGGNVYENKSGTAAMTVGGTGDVLTGIIASLLSQGLGLEDAARLGAEINGEAGEIAAEEYGNGMVATDVVHKIPEVMR